MNITIKKFTLLIFFLLLVSTYSLFSWYYLNQREHTASVITKSLRSDMSKLAYVLSKYIRKNSILTSRSLLDREVANNDFIRDVAIFDDKLMLLNSDPSQVKALNSEELYIDPKISQYELLHTSEAFEEDIGFYEGKKRRKYSLLFFIDKEVITKVFTKNRNEFLIWCILTPIVLTFLLWLLINRYIVIPLESLRQYAYYQSKVPEKCILQELEYIRASMVQTFNRLTQERKELYKLARTDALSGLANRNLLQERAEQIIEDSKRTNKEFSLLFLDLDHFKSVNDSLGHDVGDDLLKRIAHAIHELLRLNDVVARIGGDEFVIILTQYQGTLELVNIINRIQKRLMRPWIIQTYPVNISSSIGVAIYPHDGKDLLTLMKNADIAMYEAKDNGRQQYRFFTDELNERTQSLIALANNMQTALKNKEYELFYQPQNKVGTGEIIGAEALIRWISPDKGMISPLEFIPLAEKNGFIVELGWWIVQSALQQKKRWEEEGVDIKLSINIAAKQILHNDFIKDLNKILNACQVNTSQIFFEITEYVFLEDSERIHEVFQKIKKLGIKISLDDFGTGYSSLSYLKSFPIDVVKIDKAFLDDYETADGSVFLETIVKMAHNLNLTVVAEGVEYEKQVSYLKELNCSYYQGYLCSEPLPIDAFDLLYQSNKHQSL